MSFWKKLLNLYLYGSFHISIGAAVLVYSLFLVINMPVRYEYVFFTFFATLLMYSIHRIVGINKLSKVEDQGRFQIINTYQQHIFIYAIIATIACLFYFFTFSRMERIVLIPAIILSISYAVPLINKKRLRDLGYVKIFLISISWAYVSATVPLYFMGIESPVIHILLFLERLFFIFALTIPFDIRDLEVDLRSGVKTIPSAFGKKKSIVIALVLILLALVAAILLYLQLVYSLILLLGIIFFYGMTAYFIYKSSKIQSDYYFTGVLDGFILIYGAVTVILVSFL